MLVYQATKREFMDDAESDAIVRRISDEFQKRLHRPNPGEVRAWQNSMQYMYKVLNTQDIPGQCGVAIEFGVPYTSSRIDFLLTGRSASTDAAVIIELKQWDSLRTVPNKDGVVQTYVAGAQREVPHPSYQAWSYARMIEDYNEAVREAQIALEPCAYLHNYRMQPTGDPLVAEQYAGYLEKAPVFCAGDIPRLREFICRHITEADDGKVLYEIESGRLRPSKSLQDALASMLAGNDEFVMIDDQKVVFEAAVELALDARKTGRKQVLIVRGGPGTGKSVVAVNLLVRLTNEDLVCQYVSKNSAPRNVYSRLLQGRNRSRAYISNLFRGPGKFFELPEDSFDALVVDEAHRLNEKSGLYRNLGDNQMRELIDAARFTVFFIDEQQRVTMHDAGAVADIRLFAERAGADVVEMELTSQFRCNGSDAYLNWLDDVLGIQPMQVEFGDLDYDFRVFDEPNELFEAIRERNGEANKARVVAGYCWEWPTKTRSNPNAAHVVIEEHDFARPWNLASTDTWAIDEESVEQVGCVHTSQGLEFDYVGVIVGDDMRFEDGRIVTDTSKRAKTDQSLRGIKAIQKEDPERAQRTADEIIRNTYRVLMTRGMKGCYVFCTDEELREYLRSKMPQRQGAYQRRFDAEPQLAAEDNLEDEAC